MRDARVHFVTTRDEKEVLWRIAQLDGERPSVVLRRLIKAEAARRGLWPMEQLTQTVEEEVRSEQEG